MTESTGFIYKTKPWPHQRKALEYLYARSYGALYTEPGTGKTKVMLDLIVNRGWKRGIIVGTALSCDVWESQFGIHTSLQTNFIHNLHSMSGREKLSFMNKSFPRGSRCPVEETCILIINYESIWREPFASTLFRKGCHWDFVICDESHHIKTPSSQQSMFLRKLGKVVPNRYLVTGTPMSENPLDVYAQYRFLQPEIFGTNYGKFRERYENLDAERSMKVGYRVLDSRQPYKNLDELREKVFSCAYYVASPLDLPKQHNTIVRYTLSPECQNAYMDIQKDGIYYDNGNALEVKAAISKILRLQQIACGFAPLTSPEGETSLKIIDHRRAQVLKNLLEQFDHNEPVVIFATFRQDFEEIKAVCKELKRPCSEVSGVENSKDRFVAGKTNTIAVQYRSGSESIDLTRARYCIYYSLTISLALYIQSKKRIHRPGQTRPVTYWHIIGEVPSVRHKGKDREILKALKNKEDVVEYIIRNEARE